jgi:hypothetical protein
MMGRLLDDDVGEHHCNSGVCFPRSPIVFSMRTAGRLDNVDAPNHRCHEVSSSISSAHWINCARSACVGGANKKGEQRQ